MCSSVGACINCLTTLTSYAMSDLVVLDKSTFPQVVDKDLCLPKLCQKKFQVNDSSPLVFQLVCMLTSMFSLQNKTHTSIGTKTLVRNIAK